MKKRRKITIERNNRFSYIDKITGLPRLGRPPRFSDPLELEKAGMAYFKSCWTKIKTIDKKTKKKVIYWKHTRPYTITGLAVALGMSRVTLLDYEKNIYGTQNVTEGEVIDPDYEYSKEERKQPATFSNIVKKLKNICQQFGEERLYQGHAAGPIFNLCNNYERWYQKQITELGGREGGDIPLSITITSEVDEEI